MAKSVGCTDFSQDCSFRITADEGQEDMMVDVATAHAMRYHRDVEPDEPAMRVAIRSQIKTLMTQAHMSDSDVTDQLG